MIESELYACGSAAGDVDGSGIAFSREQGMAIVDSTWLAFFSFQILKQIADSFL